MREPLKTLARPTEAIIDHEGNECCFAIRRGNRKVEHEHVKNEKEADLEQARYPSAHGERSGRRQGRRKRRALYIRLLPERRLWRELLCAGIPPRGNTVKHASGHLWLVSLLCGGPAAP